MANMNFIHPRLATGGDCGYGEQLASNVADLVVAGITDIIDMREEYSDEDSFAVLAPQIRYHYIPMDDAGQTEGDSTWQAVADAAIGAFQQRREAKVLVHCHMGINRGPSAAFAILLATGWEPAKALAAIRDARPIAAIAYSHDVLRWYQSAANIDKRTAAGQRSAVERWHAANWIDVVRIIRDERMKDGAASR